MVSDLCLLKYAQVHVGLGHTSQRRLQSTVSSILNVIGAELNRHPPPRITTGTPTHPQPTDTFLSPNPYALPNCAYLPLQRSCYLSAPAGLPSLFLSSWYPPSYSVLFTLALGTLYCPNTFRLDWSQTITISLHNTQNNTKTYRGIITQSHRKQKYHRKKQYHCCHQGDFDGSSNIVPTTIAIIDIISVSTRLIFCTEK